MYRLIVCGTARFYTNRAEITLFFCIASARIEIPERRRAVACRRLRRLFCDPLDAEKKTYFLCKMIIYRILICSNLTKHAKKNRIVSLLCIDLAVPSAYN